MGQGWLIAADSGPLIPTFARGLAPPRKVHTRRVTPVIIKFAPVVRRRAGNIAKGGQIYRFDYRFPENRDDFEQSTPSPRHLARVESIIIHQTDTRLSNERWKCVFLPIRRSFEYLIGEISRQRFGITFVFLWLVFYFFEREMVFLFLRIINFKSTRRRIDYWTYRRVTRCSALKKTIFKSIISLPTELIFTGCFFQYMYIYIYTYIHISSTNRMNFKREIIKIVGSLRDLAKIRFERWNTSNELDVCSKE